MADKQQKHVLIVYAEHESQSLNGVLLRSAVETLTSNGHCVEVSDLYSMHFEARTDRTDIVEAESSERQRQKQDENNMNGSLQTVMTPDVSEKGNMQNAEYFKYQKETRTAYQKNALSDDIKSELEKLKRADLVIFIFPLYWFSFPSIMKGWFDRVFVMGFAYGSGQLYHDGPLKGKKAMLSFTTGAPEEAFSTCGMNGDMNVVLWPMQHGTLTFVGFDVLAPAIHYAAEYVSTEVREKWRSDWCRRLNNIFEEQPLHFVHVSNFSNFVMKEDYLKSQADEKLGPSVGYHLGKPIPPNCMLKPQERSSWKTYPA